MADTNTSAEITAQKQKVIGRPFQKGVSGNPNGRPVGSVSIVEGIKRKLLEVEPVNKKTYLELFLNTYFKNAIKEGDATLIRDMINRIDGMPKQTIGGEGEDGSIIVKIKDYGTKHNFTTEAEGSPTNK